MDFLQQLYTLRAEISQISIPADRREEVSKLLSHLDHLINFAIPYAESVLSGTDLVNTAVINLDDRWWKSIDFVIGNARRCQYRVQPTEPFIRLHKITNIIRQWTIDQVFDDDITVDDLIVMLDVPNYHIRCEAVLRLKNNPSVVEKHIPDLMQRMVDSASGQLRFAIKKTLVTVSYAAVPYLMTLLARRLGDKLRRHAMWVLPLMGLDALKAIVEAWPNADDYLRWTMTALLHDFLRSPEMVMPLLLEGLQSSDSRLKFEALEAVEHFATFASDALPILEALLKDEPDIARRREIEGVIKLIAEAG